MPARCGSARIDDVIAWAQHQSHAPLTREFAISLTPLPGVLAKYRRSGERKNRGRYAHWLAILRPAGGRATATAPERAW